MASLEESPSDGEVNNNNTDEDAPMLDEPISPSTLSPGPPVDSITWVAKKWCLDIWPPSKSNDAMAPPARTMGITKTVDGCKAFRLYSKNALATIPSLQFFSTDHITFFDQMTASPTNDHIASFFHSAIGPREHGFQKFHMEFVVRYHSISFNAIKTKLLPFLHTTDTCLAQQGFASLDIHSAGFFTLCHPQWTDLPWFTKSVTCAIKQYIHNLDTSTLSPEQRDSLEPLLADNCLPSFEIHVQRGIRAYYLQPSTAGNPENRMDKKQPNKKLFISTGALELRCKHPCTVLFARSWKGSPKQTYGFLVNLLLTNFGRNVRSTTLLWWLNKWNFLPRPATSNSTGPTLQL